jgi:hypothetical protein
MKRSLCGEEGVAHKRQCKEPSRISREQRLLRCLRQMFEGSGEDRHFVAFCEGGRDMDFAHYRNDVQPISAMILRFRLVSLPQLRAIRKLCDSSATLSRELLQHPLWLQRCLVLWMTCPMAQVGRQQEELVGLMRTFHRQHRRLLQQKVVACIAKAERYRLMKYIVSEHNEGRAMQDPPYMMGTVLLSVLMACGIFRREQVKMVANGFFVLHQDLDCHYQHHQQLLLQLDPEFMESPIMTQLVIFRSQCELQRQFLCQPTLVRCLQKMLQHILSKRELKESECEALLVLASWRSTVPADIEMATLGKLVHAIIGMPVSLETSTQALHTLKDHIRRLPPPQHHILRRAIGRWAAVRIADAHGDRCKENFLTQWEGSWKLFQFAGTWLQTYSHPPLSHARREAFVRLSVRILCFHVEHAEDRENNALQQAMGHICDALTHCLDPSMALCVSEAVNVVVHAAVRLHPGWMPCATSLMLACAQRCPTAAAALRQAPKYDERAMAKVATTCWPAAMPSLRSDQPASPPNHYLCPIMCELMQDPVELPSSKQVMDRSSLERHLAARQTDPFTNAHLTADMVHACPGLRCRIQEWRQKHRC